jgi:hypothetical protein
MCRDEPNFLASSIGVNGVGECRHLTFRRLEIAKPKLRIARESDPDRIVSSPLGKRP